MTQNASPQPKPKRRRRWRKRIGCGCLSTLFALGLGLVALEWTLRANTGHFLGAPAQALSMYELDGERSFRLVPGWRGEQTIEARTTSIRINDAGNRGPELGPKQPNETRIAVIGDSFVFGHGAAEEETIPFQAQQFLANRVPRGKSVTVLNCGVSGQGLRDAVNSVERSLALAPDAIAVVSYIGNDFADDCREFTAITEGFLLFGGAARAAFRSTRFRLTLRYRSAYFFDQLLTRYAPSLAFDRSVLGPTPEEVLALEHFPEQKQRRGCLFFDRTADDALVAKILKRCRASLTAIRNHAGQRPVLLVLLPSRWHVDSKIWRATLVKLDFDPKAHEMGKAQKRMTTLGQSLGMRVLDLTSPLSQGGAAFWFKTDNHLAPPGYRQAGLSLGAAVADMLGW